jgi:hypothetical protein
MESKRHFAMRRAFSYSLHDLKLTVVKDLAHVQES